MFPSKSNQAKVLFALYDLAEADGFTGSDFGPQALNNWEYMEEKTDLSRPSICRTLVNLEKLGLVSAVLPTENSGAHLGGAGINAHGMSYVDDMRANVDPIPVIIAGIAPDVVDALRNIVRLAEQHDVEHEELKALKERVAAVEQAPDPTAQLERAADVMTMVSGSQSLLMFFVTYILPKLG